MQNYDQRLQQESHRGHERARPDRSWADHLAEEQDQRARTVKCLSWRAPFLPVDFRLNNHPSPFLSAATASG